MAEALSQLGVRRFGVATVQEGVLLREAGRREDIIVMGGILPGQVKDLVQANLIPVLSDADAMQALSQEIFTKHPPLPRSPQGGHRHETTGIRD